MGVIAAFVAVAAVASAACSGKSHHAPTDPGVDLTFGTGGVALIDIHADGVGSDLRNFFLLPDGRIVGAGYAIADTAVIPTFARISAAGSLDTSFGVSGLATFSNGFAYDAITTNGMFVAGVDRQNGTEVFRLLADGSPDTSFGQGGSVITTDGSAARGIVAAAGGYLVSGFAGPSAMVRGYTSGGAINAAFASNGTATLTRSGFTGVGFAIAAGPGSTYVQAGSLVSTSGALVYPFVARWLANGTPDPSFGSGGLVVDSASSGVLYVALAVQSDGSVVVAGTDTTTHTGVLRRYDGAGAADTGFGSGGTVSVPTIPRSVLITPDGSILIDSLSLDGLAFRVDRFLADGSPDIAFGTAGAVQFTFEDIVIEAPKALAVDADGKILVGGAVEPPGNDDLIKWAIVRFLP